MEAFSERFLSESVVTFLCSMSTTMDVNQRSLTHFDILEYPNNHSLSTPLKSFCVVKILEETQDLRLLYIVHANLPVPPVNPRNAES